MLIWIIIMHVDQVPLSADEFYKNIKKNDWLTPWRKAVLYSMAPDFSILSPPLPSRLQRRWWAQAGSTVNTRRAPVCSLLVRTQVGVLVSARQLVPRVRGSQSFFLLNAILTNFTTKQIDVSGMKGGRCGDESKGMDLWWWEGRSQKDSNFYRLRKVDREKFFF